MSITTVTGDISKDKLGKTLPHEHIFCDLRSLVGEYSEIGRRNIFEEKITLQNYGHLRRNPYAVLDNAVINELNVQEAEVLEWRKAGGDSIVDVTTDDFGRDVDLLYGISRTTGVNIIAGCGYYVDASLKQSIKALTVQQMTEIILRDLTEGVNGTGIKAGVIGEVGTSARITEAEFKSLEASAIAQQKTGAAMHIHACLWNRTGIEAAQFAIDHGAIPEKICVDHADVVLDMGYIEALLKMGVKVEFDNFGKEFYVDRRYRNLLDGSFATDMQRVQALKYLIDKGYTSQLLITCDICLKMLTHAYGGWGYDHILRNIVPMMGDFEIMNEQIQKIIIVNPANFLDK